MNTMSTALKPDQTALPRAKGCARISAKRRGAVTALDDLYQSGAMKALFPRTWTGTLEAVLVNTAGGLAEGDRFETEVSLEESAQATITTQAAERVYRADGPASARAEAHLSLGPDARLNWLPNETILFDGSALSRSFTANLAPTAELLFVEPVILGRAAHGERYKSGRYRDHVRILRDGQPIFRDATDLTTTDLASPFTLADAGAMALAVFASPAAQGQLEPIRRMLPETAGASLLAADLLTIRMIAEDGYSLRQSLVPILERLNGAPLPKTWTL